MLIIENQFITIKWNCKNKRHYEKLGYIFTKLNDPLIIKAEHLTKITFFLIIHSYHCKHINYTMLLLCM